VITARASLFWAAGGSSIAVPDGCLSGLSSAFKLLADDPALAKALGSAARRRALTMFAPTAAAPHLVAAIDRAEAEHRRIQR
jgi:hypothetical protein